MCCCRKALKCQHGIESECLISFSKLILTTGSSPYKAMHNTGVFLSHIDKLKKIKSEKLVISNYFCQALGAYHR